MLLSLPSVVVVCHIAAQLPGKDRWRLRCASKKVRQMILDSVPRPWSFMTDFTGRHVRFFGRLANHWQRNLQREPDIYHPNQFHDPAACVAVYNVWDTSRLLCTDFFDDVPFVRDDFMDVIRERIFIGYLDTVFNWMYRREVHMDNGGFFIWVDTEITRIGWFDGNAE